MAEDTVGRHDTIYGCCSNLNNMLRYGVENGCIMLHELEDELARHGMGREAIVPNVNWFMSVPVLEDGSAGVATAAPARQLCQAPGRMQCAGGAFKPSANAQPCNGYRPTAIKITIS